MEDDRRVISRLWRVAGTGELVGVERLGGRSHRVYECVPSRGTRLIVRLADAGGARFAMETAVIRRCAQAGVPVPTVRYVGVVTGQSDADIEVMVQEKVLGESITRHGAAVAVSAAGEALAVVHGIATTGYGPLRQDLSGPAATLGGWFVDGIDEKLAAARRIDAESVPLLDRAAALLAEHRDLLDACPAGLAHGDFSPDNVLVGRAGQVTAILDWESAKSGPPELDLGWWACGFDTPSTPVARLIEGYARHRELDPERLSVLCRLVAVRVAVGHYAWTAAKGHRNGVRQARARLTAALTPGAVTS